MLEIPLGGNGQLSVNIVELLFFIVVMLSLFYYIPKRLTNLEKRMSEMENKETK